MVEFRCLVTRCLRASEFKCLMTLSLEASNDSESRASEFKCLMTLSLKAPNDSESRASSHVRPHLSRASDRVRGTDANCCRGHESHRYQNRRAEGAGAG